MTITDYDKLKPEEKHQYFYNCRNADTCPFCGSIMCMNGCKGRIVFESSDSKKK